MVNRKELESEAGHASGMQVAPWSWFQRTPSEFIVDPLEDNPDLRFPDSVAVFEAMSRTDPQVSANIRAMKQPILSANWSLEGSNVRPEVMNHVRKNLGMAVEGEPRQRRRREGVMLTDHLRDALSCLVHGFAVFEQQYIYNPTDGLYHLRKLGPRPQRTIRHIYVGKDGGLVGIEQEPPPSRKLTIPKPVFIPVKDLVWYVLDKEGADWTGTSVLRSAYKPWLLKDRAERITAQAIERNAMGVPVAFSDEMGDAGSAIDTQLSNFRAGATAYAKFPLNTRVELMSPKGGLIDPLPFIKRQDESISKSMLAMFLDLGHDTGARSLGETFQDMFLVACQAVADTIADVVTEHVIRDLVEHNFGSDADYPVLTPGNLVAAKGLDVEGTARLADAGLLVSDKALRGSLRTRYGFPEEDPATVAPEPTPAPETALSDPGHLDRQEALITRLEELRKDR